MPGLDEVLGGGLPEFSFNLIAGGPGVGQDDAGACSSCSPTRPRERPACTSRCLGETSLKMLRYQQQFELLRSGAASASDVHFVNLSEEALAGDLDGVLARIIEEVDRLHPGVVVVDSFRSLVRAQGAERRRAELEHFVQRLALHLTTWEVTSFLIGEYSRARAQGSGLHRGRRHPLAIAGGEPQLGRPQAPGREGRAAWRRCPDLHTMRITDAGVQVFPRIPERSRRRPPAQSTTRLSTGIAGLDEMMGGGIPAGIRWCSRARPARARRRSRCKFVAAGLARGRGRGDRDLRGAPGGVPRSAPRASRWTCARRSSEDKLAHHLSAAARSLGRRDAGRDPDGGRRRSARTRVVIDSISGFEIALAPTFREDFRESLYRLIGALTGLGVTMFSTVEVVERAREHRAPAHRVPGLVPDRRHHQPALRGDRGRAPQGDGGGEDAGQRP